MLDELKILQQQVTRLKLVENLLHPLLKCIQFVLKCLGVIVQEHNLLLYTVVHIAAQFYDSFNAKSDFGKFIDQHHVPVFMLLRLVAAQNLRRLASKETDHILEEEVKVNDIGLVAVSSAALVAERLSIARAAALVADFCVLLERVLVLCYGAEGWLVALQRSG